jgi:hypothetical protein
MRLLSLTSQAGLPPNQLEIAHARYTLVVGDLGVEGPEPSHQQPLTDITPEQPLMPKLVARGADSVVAHGHRNYRGNRSNNMIKARDG